MQIKWRNSIPCKEWLCSHWPYYITFWDYDKDPQISSDQSVVTPTVDWTMAMFVMEHVVDFGSYKLMGTTENICFMN